MDDSRYILPVVLSWPVFWCEYSLGETILEEVPVQVTDPLDVDSHHSAAHRQLGVVAPGSRDHVPWPQ